VNQSYIITNDSKTQVGGFDWNGDFIHKFKKPSHEFTLAGQWSHFKNTTDYQTIYNTFNPNQIAANDGINDEYTIQADYSLPITEKIKLEAGAKTIMRDITSNSLVQLANPSGDYIIS